MQDRKVDLFVVGAPKAGTTSIYSMLAEHPSVFTARTKEPGYFAFPDSTPRFRGPGDRAAIKRFYVCDRARYFSLFSSAGEDQLIGDFSTNYLYSPCSARNIFDHNPDAKIVVVLRRPIDRAYSNWQHHIRDAREKLSFTDAVDAEDTRIASKWGWHWSYTGRSFYADSLARYFDLFDTTNIKVFLFEDLTSEHFLDELCRFLEISPHSAQKLPTKNASENPRSKTVNFLVKRCVPLSAKRLVPPRVRRAVSQSLNRGPGEAKIDPAIAFSEIHEMFRDDVLKTSALIGRDLNHWL